MADQIKEMQRSDPTAKEQWYAYCEAYGDNIRDPAKHDVTFINSFITQYNAGARLEYKEGQELVKMIKMGQKKSQGWKAVWESYCNQTPVDGKPSYDPAKRDSAFLEGFFDFIGRMASGGGGMSMGMGMGMQGMGMQGPPLKRGPGGMGTMTGDPGKDQLIQQIKTFQRQGETQKQIWHSFCDTNLGGMYDPSRHDSTTLQMFVQQNGIQDIPVGGMGGGMGAGAGVGANHPLVVQIKTYQRMGEAQKNAWHTYCDSSGGGVKDPARHDAASLQSFIAAYGVP